MENEQELEQQEWMLDNWIEDFDGEQEESYGE